MKIRIQPLLILAGITFLLLNVNNQTIRIDSLTAPTSQSRVQVEPIPASEEGYVVYLNSDRLTDKGDVIRAFDASPEDDIGSPDQASGDSIDSIILTVPAGDDNASKMAAQLRKNAEAAGIAAEIHTKDPLLAISMAETGRFEVLVLSDTIREQYHADTLLKKAFVEAIEPEGSRIEED